MMEDEDNPYKKIETPDDDHGGVQVDVLTKVKPETAHPAMFKVLLLNDDFTPMEFVTLVLEKFFNKSHQEATEVMIQVHKKGVGLCGVFTHEVAETKVTQVMDYGRQHEQPLQCIMEKD